MPRLAFVIARGGCKQRLLRVRKAASRGTTFFVFLTVSCVYGRDCGEAIQDTQTATWYTTRRSTCIRNEIPAYDSLLACLDES